MVYPTKAEKKNYGDVLRRQDRAQLDGARLLRSHPSDGLGVREYRDSHRQSQSSQSCFSRPFESGTVSIVGHLVVPYVGFDGRP